MSRYASFFFLNDQYWVSYVYLFNFFLVLKLFVVCSTCGKEGKQITECATNADTACQCPLSYTGANCTDSCVAPAGCASLVLSDVNNCQFSATDFSKGVPCISCKPNYYMNDANECIRM